MADNGVAMPGPMGGGYEDGFNATGQDFSNMAAPGGNSAGMDMPHGNAESEAGWLDGQDYRGLASTDPIPQGNDMGTFSDNGSVTDADQASSAGFHFIYSFEDMFGSSPVSVPGIPNPDTSHMDMD